MLPQILYLVLIIIGTAASMYLHGTVRTIDFRDTFVSLCITQSLLFWGGFYNCFFN